MGALHFPSDADDLVEDDRNDVTDIFLHDITLGETLRITAAVAGASEHPVLDAAGVAHPRRGFRCGDPQPHHGCEESDRRFSVLGHEITKYS
ncbi:MAG: hypothetical protein LJE70_01785 [Chromatiaceae bacterium]|nr:hypothetical protein [Chromatiaceae bacterium]